jgi:hypothetical protein
MMSLNWWTNILKTDFTRKELFLRITMDLLLSNLGLFLGIITTVGIWIFTFDVTPRAFFQEMFSKVWLANVPILTACCFFAYTVSGLYKYKSIENAPYLSRVLAVSKAVGTAFCFYLLWIYITRPLMPRSTMIAGWIFILVLLLTTRLIWAAFSLQYRLVPIKAEYAQIEKLVREMVLVSQQDGWVPPESMPAKAAWPYFEDDEVFAAARVLRSGKINQWTGQEVEKFQQEFAAFCGVRHAIALANGSMALDLALYTLNIGPGDEVVVTPRSFIASASCVALRGAKPVFADVDLDSQNITAASIQKVITPRTRAIIAVHLAGWPCDMDPILEIAEKYRLKVIEDCAQCHGAVYYSQGPRRDTAISHGTPIERNNIRLYPRPTGSLGHIATFSFCQDKIMTTGGEGGLLVTDDDALWEKAWAYKDHGKSYDAIYRQQHPSGFRWLHDSFGTNGRMTEMQAAIGRVQLKKLPGWVATRQHNAAILTEGFSNIPGLRVTKPPETVRHAYYKYYVFVQPAHLKEGWDRNRIMNALIDEQVPCFSGCCSELYLEKAFEGSGQRPVERLPVAKELGETSLMFLVHHTLAETDMERMVVAVSKVMEQAGY